MSPMFHATTLDSAQRIADEGFSLTKVKFGRFLGDGVYLTTSLMVAGMYAQDPTMVILTCDLTPQTRVYKMQAVENHDTTAGILRKRFGEDITTGLQEAGWDGVAVVWRDSDVELVVRPENVRPVDVRRCPRM